MERIFKQPVNGLYRFLMRYFSDVRRDLDELNLFSPSVSIVSLLWFLNYYGVKNFIVINKRYRKRENSSSSYDVAEFQLLYTEQQASGKLWRYNKHSDTTIWVNASMLDGSPQLSEIYNKTEIYDLVWAQFKRPEPFSSA